MRMSLLKLFALSSVAYLSISSAYANPDFAGVYRCAGFDPYINKEYKGTVVITPQNTVYDVSMTYDTGEKLVGTAGLYDVDTLSVVFQDPKNLKKVGLEQYRYKDKDDHNTMQGFWVYLGKDKLGKEVCVRQTS